MGAKHESNTPAQQNKERKTNTSESKEIKKTHRKD